ncbi:MAG: hypothetical protein GY953_42915, partial [bacterium]|nr:hypothetical protein [bacterium]
MLDAGTGEVTWTPGPGQAGDFYVTFLANDGERKARQTIVMRASLEPIPPVVRIELTPSFPAVPGQPLLIQVVADSLSDITGITLLVDGVETALDAKGRAVITPDAAGKVALRATALDADGYEGEQLLTLKVRDPEDRTAPDIAVDPALSFGALEGVVEVTGQVADQNLDYWRLELMEVDSDVVLAEVASGEDTVDSVLGTLDTRTLLNGFYRLRLTAADIGRRLVRTEAVIEINGVEKTGRFTDERVDVAVDFSGISFELLRRYDSLARPDADFGSWSAGFDMDLALSTTKTGR